MTAEQLLQILETLTFSARIHHMIDSGRTSLHDSELASTITMLEQGGFYERFLAIYSCFGSSDGAHVLRALADPSRIIRGVAIKLTTLACDEAQLRQALEIVPRDGRLPLLWKLHHHGDQLLIDAFLEQLAETQDLQLLKLLPCGSPALVRRHIARVQPLMRLTDWRQLTRRHPAITFELLQTRAASTTVLDLQLVAFVNAILPILAQKQPDLALMLVETLARSVPLSRLNLQVVLAARPVQLIDFILHYTGDLGELDFSSIAGKLDDKQLLALRETYPARVDDRQPESWFRQIPPARRAGLYAAFRPIWSDHYRYGHIPAEIVALLPPPQREQEGRRLLHLPSLALHPEERLVYAAFLPWNEARGVLDPFLHDSAETVRTAALQTLVHTASYEREHFPEVLEIVRAHLHEPDFVYGAVLQSLTRLPKSIWRVEHLESMEYIIQGVIDAFDSSRSTTSTLLVLITRLLPCAPAWSAAQFARVARAYGITFPYSNIDEYLSNADVKQLGPALHPVLTLWAERGDEKKLQPLLSVFGRRVGVFEELLDALELVFNHKLSFDFGNQILLTLIKYRPERSAQLIPELLKKDQSWITYPAVLYYLLHRRQDLLTPFLKHTKYCDLFNNVPVKIRHKRRWRGIRPLVRGYALWTARQQIAFARTLREVILDETTDHALVGRATVRLFALPAIPDRDRLALTKNHQPFIRDLALIHLCQLDDATTILPTLLEALHDERATRALYTLHPILLTLPTQQALTILRSVPLTRVTLAKEVVRVLGEMPGEAAFQELLALEGQNLHRDVRAALMRAFERHLGRDEAWHILESESGSADPLIALSTARFRIGPTLAKAHRVRTRFERTRRNGQSLHYIFWLAEWNTVTMAHLSGEQLEFKAQQRLMRLYALLLARPEPDIQAVVLSNCTRLPAADEGQLLLTRLLELVDTDNEEICAAAAEAIFGGSLASDAALIGQAIKGLLSNRRALLAISSALQKALTFNRQQLLPIIRAILAALAVDPLTIGLRIELAIAALPWDEIANILTEAATTGALHADALQQACETLGQVVDRYSKISRPDCQKMIHLEEQLAASNDERLRRIALAALVAQTKESNTWNAEQRIRLQTYRADPSSLVAAAAQFTMLPNAEA